ncbi:MAG TPA: co-chaperone GroES [Bryobacteraceae bacterium]
MSSDPRPSVEEARRYRSVVASPITRDQRDMRLQANVEHVRPYHEDRVLVRRVAPPADGRIVLMENQEGREKVGHQYGVVVAVAEGSWDVRPGDRVIYARWPANEFEQGGETYTFVYEEQAILCVLEAEPLPRVAAL